MTKGSIAMRAAAVLMAKCSIWTRRGDAVASVEAMRFRVFRVFCDADAFEPISRDGNWRMA
jgi:hypothetical protein